MSSNDNNKNKKGVWEEVEVIKTPGKIYGTATVKMDSFFLGDIINGLNGTIAAFEKLQNQQGGKLPKDKQAEFDDIKLLRDKVESTRDKTLKE